MRRVKFKVVSVTYVGKRRYSAFAGGLYNLEYPKSAIVRAREGTLGVAVFKTRKQAESFKMKSPILEIVRVRPIGRGKTAGLVCEGTSRIDLDNFYNNDFLSLVMVAPLGTIFYPAVEVLE